jgi:valyl-tRNA synthetase
MNIEDLKELSFDNLKPEDKWILSKYNKIVKNVTKHMDKYDFNIVGSELYNFVYDDFCSNYIEMAKYSIDDATTKSVLCYVLTGILKMLHPFMPFVTEEIYQMLPIKEFESIMISSYPKYDKKQVFEVEEEIVEDEITFIKNFRNVKAENNITKDMKIMFDTDDDNELIVKLLKLTDNVINEPLGMNAYKVFSTRVKATIYFEKQMSEADEELRQQQIKSLEDSIARREKLLANENYVNKAPANIVEMDRQKLEEEKKKLEELKK